MNSTRRTTVLKGTLIVVTALALFAVGTVLFVSGQRSDNERNASTTLKTLSSAEADFRANDRDWNHVNDFWTGDVKSLYTLTSAAVRGAALKNAKDPPVRLIEL